MKTLRTAICATALTALSAPSFAASSDILFVLDGSGSMWGQIDGTAKIATAKSTMGQLIDNVPVDARLGLMTYGTTSKDSCTDVSVMNDIGADREAIKASIAGVTPLGKTPIQKSLIDGLNALQGSEPSDVQKSLVLISDGIETCDGDPCAVAATAQERGVDMRVHVVGFDVDGDARSQLECIADAGGGQYFDASDTDGFKNAMAAVVQVAQAQPEPEPEPEPEAVEEPAGPTITEFFRDDFDGTELAEHWAIEGADPDSFIVEDGVLTMLSTANSGFGAEEPINLITYTGELPSVDWDISITFTGELSATRNRLQLGLRKDHQSHMNATFLGDDSTICQSTRLVNTKVSNGTEESVERIYRGDPSRGNCYTRFALGAEAWSAIVADHETIPTVLTFSKRGRSYTATMTMDGLTTEDGEPYIITTDQFTSLRSPGDLSFSVDRPPARIGQSTGEVLLFIDSLVINTVEQP
ncbi:MAG: VWA domain-containing protein [Pseudomonadota bacterium]